MATVGVKGLNSGVLSSISQAGRTDYGNSPRQRVNFVMHHRSNNRWCIMNAAITVTFTVNIPRYE